jgi:hypothetical protein
MGTITRHIINPDGVVSIEIEDENGVLVELIPGASGVLLDTFSIAMLDEPGVTAVIEALERWKTCRRVL